MGKKTSYLYAFLILFIIKAKAQTTNKGMLYISENTIFSTVETFDNKKTASFYNDGNTYIYKGFHNDGVVDFYANTGLTNFIGHTSQFISGQNPSHFYNILFKNSSSDYPFQLSGDLIVYGMVNFYEGIVDNDNFGGSFIFHGSAEHTNTSDFSYVDGKVIKLGNENFTYPIGSQGYYRFAGISSISTSNNYEAQYHLTNSDADYPHELRAGIISLINNKEYWVVAPKDTIEETMLTLSWREGITPDEIIAEPQENNIHIVRWDKESNMWINEGGLVDHLNQTVTTAVEKYGVFTLARIKGESILPCDVVVYNAVTPNNDGINDYFRIDTSNSQCARNLNVKIFNRWGVQVYESDNYGVNDDVFRGFSDGRATLNRDGRLPTGTYFYVLDYEYDVNNETSRHKKAGYLYLNGN